MNSRLTNGVLFTTLFSLLGTTALLADATTPKPSKDKDKALKYRNKAHEKPVIFYSRESLTSDKKIARRGVLLKRPQAKATVLICHGFMCDKYDISLLQMMFKDYNTMVFDFRAHGEYTQGQCCTLGRDESYDVVAAAHCIKNDPDLKNLPLIVYGFSMGAVAAIIAQAREKNLFDSMILDCPFDSSDKLVERAVKQLKINIFGYERPLPGASMLNSYRYNPYVQSALKTMLRTFTKFDDQNINVCLGPVYPEEAIKYVDIPCFFICCVNDDKAPVEAVLSVYNGAKGYKRCWIDHEGDGHYRTIFRQMHKYFYKVDRFAQHTINGTFSKKAQEKVKRDKPYCVISAAKPVQA